MDNSHFLPRLLEFLDASTTPFHAVENLARRLDAAGYARLQEHEDWDLGPHQRAYVVRNGGSLVALRAGRDCRQQGLRMVGAHTDSPCLRVKPMAELREHGCLRLGVEVYGGVLLNPWFDRDLSLAGRVHYVDSSGDLRFALIAFERPIAVVPSLAIHLDREANQSRTINAQRDIPPLLATLHSGDSGTESIDFRSLLAERIREQHEGADVARVLDYELSFHDTQPAAITGLTGQFISSARLDNLLSCFSGVEALLDSDPDVPALLVCNDHEEVGSASSSGAAGPLLLSVLERLVGTGDALRKLLARSMLISADNAHALHPNYADRHDSNHGPKLNGGPVIKVNANQRYASNSATQALFRHLCGQLDIPVQSFVARTDMACGSTIGPITASELGVRTLDVGIPQLAMHSIRELCGSEDPLTLARALSAFQSLPELPEMN
ncbi:MAG: M18 family aminopeptidase [Gammaproteobacteria bacterium]|nr:M18 family aminopeptidase [Gammaproteobacteria bacterium]